MKHIKPRFWVILLSCLMLTAVLVYASQQNYLNRQSDVIDDLEAQKAALSATNLSLKDDIDYTYTDEYIEREARSKLGLLKPGEILFSAND